ncbi:uncharacterized protein LOC111642152 [Centruroides sculpturatus]|uniref:uncharacterized protein LOC111642152 n=1 Tax=Centruroides sculpturatus TaxID=218467 RepID=UPI000C6C8F24|nr:uncharacterized protein LOC111642152 [Centruroides sculpturatus]
MRTENEMEENGTIVRFSKKFVIPSRSSTENDTQQTEMLLRIQIKARKELKLNNDKKAAQNGEMSSTNLPVTSTERESTKFEKSKLETVKKLTEDLDCDLKLANGKNVDISQIPDISVDAAENLFRYMDTQELRIQSVPVALNMLKVAEKLIMQDVVRRCLSFLLQNIDENNVLCIYRQLKFSNESHSTDNFKNELINKCLNIIDIHAENIIKGKDFINLEVEVIKDIICRSTLQIPSRAVIIEALKSWANRDCKCCLLLNHCSLLGENARCFHSIVVRDAIETVNNNNNNCFAQIDRNSRAITSRGNFGRVSPGTNPVKKLNKSKLKRNFGDIFWNIIKIFD